MLVRALSRMLRDDDIGDFRNNSLIADRAASVYSNPNNQIKREEYY